MKMRELKMILAIGGCLCCWVGASVAGLNNGAEMTLWDPEVVGDTLCYRVTVSSAVKTTGVLVRFQFSPSSLAFASWETGDFIDDPLTWGPYEHEEKQTVMIAVATTNKVATTRASGEVGTAKFVRIGPGEVEVTVVEGRLSDEDFREDLILHSGGEVQFARPAEAHTPVRFALRSAMPNPVTKMTEIRFDVPRPGADVKLKIYDVRGREVCTLLSDRRAPGYYSQAWDGTNTQGARVAPGVYFCRMEAGEFRDTRKLVLLK